MNASKLMEAVVYDSETGLMTRRVASTRAKAGAPVGCLDSDGYLVAKVGGKSRKVHRLAWLYVHGEFPDGEIDHRDGDKANNLMSNLRVVTSAGNKLNLVRATKRSVSGVLGVRERPNGFEATLCRKYLGTFPTIELASNAYSQAKEKLTLNL